ncbi:MAG: MBL fold metallo-hydrolase [Gordonia sp. (in: high G+C Gram-positive bacteria)]
MTPSTGTTNTAGGESLIGRIVGAGVRAADAAATALAAAGVPAARAVGAERKAIAAHVAGSPNLVGAVFANPEPPMPGADMGLGVLVDMVRRPGRPARPIPVLAPRFAPDASALTATWLGHASVLVELDGLRILTDPVLSRRCSPSGLIGPSRMHPSPVTVADLPAIDIVLISHDHYDHLDMETVTALAVASPDAIFVTPVGVDAHLIAWGITADRIRSADWWETLEIEVVTASTPTRLRFTCGPARHFSGRGPYRNLTQWASWAVVGPGHRFFFSGDTGYTERFDELGTRLGPFDLTLVAVGAYDPAWPDVHVTPEEAVAIHRMVSGAGGRDSLFIPIHWGTFNLARHGWGEPIVRLLPHAARNGTTVAVPTPGGTVDVASRTGSGLADPRWWEASA